MTTDCQLVGWRVLAWVMRHWGLVDIHLWIFKQRTKRTNQSQFKMKCRGEEQKDGRWWAGMDETYAWKEAHRKEGDKKKVTNDIERTYVRTAAAAAVARGWRVIVGWYLLFCWAYSHEKEEKEEKERASVMSRGQYLSGISPQTDTRTHTAPLIDDVMWLCVRPPHHKSTTSERARKIRGKTTWARDPCVMEMSTCTKD